MMKKKETVLILSLIFSAVITVTVILEKIAEINYQKKNTSELLQKIAELNQNPCPKEFFYYVGYSGSACVPEQIINPANRNAEKYVKDFVEWNENEKMNLHCSDKSPCWHDGDFIPKYGSDSKVPMP